MNGAHWRVLLIEDNIIDARLVSRMLGAVQRFDVRTAPSLADGLAALRSERFELVLLDLWLPDSSGLETLRKVQAVCSDIPVVVLSGDEDGELAIAAVQAGAQDYLVKGRFNSDLLTRSVRYAIERKRTHDVLDALARRLTLHVESSPLAVVEWGSNLEIVRWAGGAQRIFGWRADEALGKSRADLGLTPEADERKTAAQFARLCSGERRNSRLGNRSRRKDGTVIYCEWSNSALLEPSGRLCSILSLVQDVTARKAAEERLSIANKRLRKMSVDLLRSQDVERRRIARELHDSTAQVLAALILNLKRLQKRSREPERIGDLLADSLELASAGSREIRTLTYLLHPPVLDDIGLVGALQTYVEGFAQRTGIKVDLSIPADFGRLDDAVELALFRIVQEGLGNVHQHSRSGLASIRLEHRSGEVRLHLQDRGCGSCDGGPKADPRKRLGVGLMSMTERAEQLGGSLQFESTASGARVTARLPVN